MSKPLKNPRHELLAWNLSEGMTQAEAYKLAGFKNKIAWKGASEVLRRNKNIQRRITQLLEEREGKRINEADAAAKARNITTQTLIDRIQEIAEKATAEKNYAAALMAYKELGVLSGKRIERRAAGAPGEFAEIESLSSEELEKRIKAEIEAGKVAKLGG
jgi:hypothetical protein